MRIFKRKPAPVSCREFVEGVTDYLEGALPRRQRLELEAHFGACPHCSLYLEQLRESIRLTGRVELEQLSPHAQDELMAAFAAWKTAASG